jgi:hypothetical protein
MHRYHDRMARPTAAATLAAKALAELLKSVNGDLSLLRLLERERAERLAQDAGIELLPPRVKK